MIRFKLRIFGKSISDKMCISSVHHQGGMTETEDSNFHQVVKVVFSGFLHCEATILLFAMN